MIAIDREAASSVQKQLVDQLRYLIASGQCEIGETLPSTRGLADEVNVSFHTVRKAYQQLQQEGLLEAQAGKGYVVHTRSALNKDARLKRGASVTRDALKSLIGLGLHPSEIDTLFDEQLHQLDVTPRALKLLFVAPYHEQAHDCAQQVKAHLQRPVEIALRANLDRHQDADFVFTRHADLQQVAQQLPQSEALGVMVYPDTDALDRVARLLANETVGLATHRPDAIPPLTQEIRTHTGFRGQVLSASINEDGQHMESFFEKIDFLVFTSQSRSHLKPLLDTDLPYVELKNIVSADSLEAIRSIVPSNV